MVRKTGLAVAAAALLLASISGYARDPFTTSVTIDGGAPINAGFTSLQDLADFYQDASLMAAQAGYTTNSAVSGAVDLRGLGGVQLSYAANSPTLQLSIPSLGINQSFAGATRDDSQSLLKEWFKGQGGAALTKVLRGLAAASPIDPVAGNPGSLMSQMAAQGFDVGIGPIAQIGAGAVNGAAAGLAPPKNLIGISARFGQYSQQNFNASVFSLPVSYTHLFYGADDTKTYALLVDLPLTYVSNNGAKSYSAMMGVGLRVPVNVHWSLTPDLRVGMVGSSDLGAASVIYSGSVTSLYQFDPIDDYRIGVANMVGYFKTAAVKAGDYKIDYALSNTVFRNGALLSHPAGFEFIGAPMWWEAQVVRTDYRGDQIYSRYTDDFSLSLGTHAQAGRIVWNALRVGFTYTYGAGDIRGWQANLGYTF